MYRSLRESFIVIQHDCLTVSWLVLNTNMQITLVSKYCISIVCLMVNEFLRESVKIKLLILMRKTAVEKKKKKKNDEMFLFSFVCACVCVCGYAAVL